MELFRGSLDAGSDIGASIRNPAHYCGVFGHKPSYGVIAPRGHALPGAVAATDISVVGPLARSAEDLALALNVMAGPDRLDEAAWHLALPASRCTRLQDFRVAVKLDDPCSEVDDEYKHALQQVADILSGAGPTVSDTAAPDLDMGRAHRVYVELLRAATSRRLSDADHVHWQHIAKDNRDDDTSYLAMMARGNTMAHRDWLALNNERHQMRLAWEDFFEEWDVLLCPVAASAAWPHDHTAERHERTIEVNGHTVLTTDQVFWAGISGAVYLPATVCPIARTSNGLPLGVQIVAGYLRDRTAITFAHALSAHCGGFEPPPGYA